jgi:hypothetical protein
MSSFHRSAAPFAVHFGPTLLRFSLYPAKPERSGHSQERPRLRDPMIDFANPEAIACCRGGDFDNTGENYSHRSDGP